MKKDKWETASEMLFGSGIKKVSIRQLSMKTKINPTTLASYRDELRKVPLGRLDQICDAAGVSAREVAEVLW